MNLVLQSVNPFCYLRRIRDRHHYQTESLSSLGQKPCGAVPKSLNEKFIQQCRKAPRNDCLKQTFFRKPSWT